MVQRLIDDVTNWLPQHFNTRHITSLTSDPPQLVSKLMLHTTGDETRTGSWFKTHSWLLMLRRLFLFHYAPGRLRISGRGVTIGRGPSPLNQPTGCLSPQGIVGRTRQTPKPNIDHGVIYLKYKCPQKLEYFFGGWLNNQFHGQIYSII